MSILSSRRHFQLERGIRQRKATRRIARAVASLRDARAELEAKMADVDARLKEVERTRP